MTQSVGAGLSPGPDRLVDDYLAAVADACAGLLAVRRDELVEDLREHITVARARLIDPTEGDVRAILERLGGPAVMAGAGGGGVGRRGPRGRAGRDGRGRAWGEPALHRAAEHNPVGPAIAGGSAGPPVSVTAPRSAWTSPVAVVATLAFLAFVLLMVGGFALAVAFTPP